MMDCDAVRERLIDLLYEELTPPERSAVEAHLAGCDACREQWDRLRFARSVVTDYGLAEPVTEGFIAPGSPVASRRVWFRVAAAAAVAAGLILAVWVFHGTGVPTAVAQPGPVEIRRLGVSLTILSRPEGWQSVPAAMQRTQMPRPQPTQQPFQVLSNMQVGASAWSQPTWRGLALVRDRRVVRRLPAGVSRVRFTNVPSGVLPDTVRLRSCDQPDALGILEQNYQYDLASASAVLKRHIDRPITVTFRDGQRVAGVLLSFDNATLVIRPAGAGPRNVSRQNVRCVGFAALPEGLLSRPTLVWDLVNRAASRQQFEVAYLTHGLSWRADYVLKLRPGRLRAAARAGADADAIADVIDLADLVGYATVNNASGVTYQDAQLKLMAGDVNLIKPPVRRRMNYLYAGSSVSGAVAPVMTEKSFFEYHLYTVTRPTTLRNAETKQLEMVSGRGLKLTRGYVYDRRANKTAARVVSELMNSEANGLGKPLPKGVVRLYAPDPTGATTYVAKTTIDHTPKDEKLRLPWGYAFDIVCSAKRVVYRRRGNEREEMWEYQVRNHKDYDVTVTVVVAVPKSTRRARCDGLRWHVRQVGIVEIDVPVRAGTVANVSFAYEWNPSSGGGLTSPHDPDR